jgi:hypothetical protein
MKNIHKKVNDFIVNQGVYGNPHNVEIVTHGDDSVSVTSDWPGETGEGDIYIEISFESNTMAEFYRVFGIKTIDDLTHITQEFLLYLYKQGQATVSCTIDTIISYYSLQFRKQHNTLLAMDVHQIEHETTLLLETPQQFIDYTQQRFLSHK